ncbi:MAG TPA: ATP-binding protein [Candidatus Polarisedimenticolaceae bacterium]|nr:ATP-binding protein [Candidatus Polarisedimenticolaceae bacterium]
MFRFAPSWGLSGRGAAILACAVSALAVLVGVRIIVVRVAELHAVLGNALSAFRDRDFGLRLAVRGDAELAELKRLYNELADAVQADRQGLQQREVLQDTILQRTPMAVVLLSAAGRVLYSNVAARTLLAQGAGLNGRLLHELPLLPSFRQALASSEDAIFREGEETFHLSQRGFRVNTQPHRLLLVERLTPELRRQEVAVWKKAIRVIHHEINNSVAPISSLLHSLRRAQEMPQHRHRLDEIHERIDERLTFLSGFLESYAEFARLPEPRRRRIAWSEILDGVRPLYPFRVEGFPAQEAEVDPSQIQQLLINLVKNAHESGSPPDEVVVSVQRAGEDCVLRVLDRGRGMSEEVMRRALVPFYSTKPGGSGLGLALGNEIVEAHGGRMRLQAREGGGTTVTCWLPAAT